MKPRIACLYGDIKSCGRNDGGPLYHRYNLCKLFGEENVAHLFPMGDLSRKGKFDLHWWTDWGEDALGMPEWECPKPNIYVTSDTHLGYDYRLKKAREFDWVFCNQRKAVEDFIRDGIPKDRCFWLPHAFDPLAYNKGIFNEKTNSWMTDAIPEKRYDVCFVGNLNDENRVNHLDRLFKEFPNFYWSLHRFHEASAVFNSSRIVFNVSARGDLNMRTFEALGSGSFLLTDVQDGMDEFFKDGVHLATYKGMDDMVDKARYYLEHEEERERIAQAGYEEAHRLHTYMHRVLEALSKSGFVDRWGLNADKNDDPGLPLVSPQEVAVGA